MRSFVVSCLLAAAASETTEAPQLLSTSVKNVRGNMGKNRIIRIPLPSKDDAAAAGGVDPSTIIGQMLESVDGDEFGVTHEGIDVMVRVCSFAFLFMLLNKSVQQIPESSLDALKEVGFKYEDTTEEWMGQFQKNFEDPNFVCQNSASACAKADNFYRFALACIFVYLFVCLFVCFFIYLFIYSFAFGDSNDQVLPTLGCNPLPNR